MNFILLILSAFWLASEIIVAAFRRSGRGALKRDRASLWIIWCVIFLAVWGAIQVERQAIEGLPELSDTLRISGIALIAVGIALRWIAIFSLKTRFTVDVAITEGHRVISHGIYGYVRHPAYAGTLISFFGLGVYFANILSLVALFVPVLAVFLYRMTIEEAALREAFGEEYADYSMKTKRLVPGIY